jgi:hypothetical protein
MTKMKNHIYIITDSNGARVFKEYSFTSVEAAYEHLETFFPEQGPEQLSKYKITKL